MIQDRKVTRFWFLAATLAFACLGSAQVSFYSNLSSPTYLNRFSVGGDGRVYFSNSTTTYVHDTAGVSTLNFSVQGVSADGTVFGGRLAGIGQKGGYLDPSGSVLDFTYSPNTFFTSFHEGDYSLSSVGEFFFGDSQIGSRSSVIRLNSLGQVLAGRTGVNGQAKIVNASDSEIILTGPGGLYSQMAAWDLTSTGKALLSENIDAVINPYNILRQFSFSTYDSATGDLAALPVLPKAYSHSSTQWRSVKAATNDSGAVVAAVITDSHRFSSTEFWHYNSILGWTNLTESYGIGGIANLDKIEITNEGVIYGTYLGQIGFGGFGPMQGFTIQAPVPEPSSMILLALGAGGFFAARRRSGQTLKGELFVGERKNERQDDGN